MTQVDSPQADRRQTRLRLPREGAYGWLAGPLGRVVLRPWFDLFAFGAITYGLLPLSRAWAAAVASRGSAEAFMAAFPGRSWPGPPIRGALRRIESRRRAYEAEARRWEDLVFASKPQDPDRLVAAELARRRAAHRLMAARALFLPLTGVLPKVRSEIAPPAEVEALHGHRLASPAAAFPDPGPVEVETSHGLAGARGPVRWLRFPSPVLEDRAWARAEGPAGGAASATVLSLHGVTIEGEMWRGLLDPLTHGLGPAVRVIRPEAPWHGRRRPEGWYGGEPFLGWGPLGPIAGFAAALAEIAVLIRWARRQGRGPVILVGVSLGALTAQLYATVSRAWPAALAPDALYLVAASGDMKAVSLDGCLARALKLRRRMEAAGWSEARLEPWLPLIQPQGPPALAPERIFLRLGARDCVIPPEGGLRLAEAWRLPEANLVRRRQGHFSLSLGVMADPLPWRRLFEQLGVEP